MSTDKAKDNYSAKESSYYPLFEFFYNEHNLVLTDGELQEIIKEAKKMSESPTSTIGEDREERTKSAVLFLEELHISGDTMVNMNHCTDELNPNEVGAIYLSDLLSNYVLLLPTQSIDADTVERK
jgi:hypothetical protein